jgi:hypothetical protein
LDPIDEDTAITITKAQLLQNYTGDDKDAILSEDITFEIASGSGVLTFDALSDTWTYTAGLNDDTNVAFAYAFENALGSSVGGRINLDLLPVNDAPELTGTQATLIDGIEDFSYTISKAQLLEGYTDAESDALSISGDVTSDVPGTLITYNSVTQTYVITAPLNYNGPVNLTYKVDDGTTSVDATQTFTLNPVNDAPEGTTGSITAIEDTPYAFTLDDFGFSDVDDGDSLSAVTITTLPSSGLLTLNGAAVIAGDSITRAQIDAGELTFASSLNANGLSYTDFTFQVEDQDGALDPVANTLTIDVTPVNDAPTSVDASASTLEDTPYTIRTSDFTFGDDEGDNLQAVKITSLPTNGTLTFNGSAVLADAVISIGDITLGKLVFTPSANENGVAYADFKFQLQDDGGTDNGGINLSEEKTFTIDVTPVNDAPALTGEKATLVNGNEGFSYTISATDLLQGYTDAEGDTLSIIDLDGGPDFTIDDNGDDTYTINPPATYNGPVNLTYKVDDGTTSIDATQTFTLRAATDVPVGTDKSLLATLSRTNTLNDGFELNRRVDALLNTRDFYSATKDAYQSYEDSEVFNKLNARQAGLSNVRLADIDELFFVGTSRGLAKEPSGDANKDVSLQDSVAAIKDKIFRNAETPPGPITDSQGRIMYKLPESVFKGGQGVIKLGATSKDGSPLPDWIKFDSKTGQLTAEVPKDMKTPLEIKVEAIDARGHKAETTLKILPRPNKLSFEGKQSLSTQFNSAFAPAR